MANEGGAPKLFWAKHKMQAVLRFLGGEDFEHVSRELGVTTGALSEWRDAFLEGGETGLKPRLAKENVEVDRLQFKIGEQVMEIELLREKIARMEQNCPLAHRRSRRRAAPRPPPRESPTGYPGLSRLEGDALDGVLAAQAHGRPHGPKAHNGTIRTERVDEMWGTDMTTIMTLSEGNVSIFFAIDHFSRELVGIHAARRGTRFEALEPIRQGVRHSFGAFGKAVAADLTLRNDHCSQFILEDFLREIAFLGIKDSPSYVREPQGNGIAEQFVRILK